MRKAARCSLTNRSQHTTLRVGGPAQVWVEPRNEAGSPELIRYCRRKIFRFSLLDEVRICSCAMAEFAALSFIRAAVRSGPGGRFPETKSRRESARTRSRWLMRAERRVSGGLEWMEGIPGAVGGGLRIDTGAMGAQTFRECRARSLPGWYDGNVTQKRRRSSRLVTVVPSLEHKFAVSAVFRESRRRRRNHPASGWSQEKRRTTQPIAKSAGCIFKNPKSGPAEAGGRAGPEEFASRSRSCFRGARELLSGERATAAEVLS